jgi:outer membrane protein assembly factor BamB
MKSLALLGLLVGTIAHASPIERLWETKAACDRASLVEWRDHLAWLHRGRVLRVHRATGKLAKPLALAKLRAPTGPAIGWADHARIEGVLGDALVIHGGHYFAVVDGVTGKLRWRADQPTTDGGLPTLVLAGGDVLWVHPAKLSAGSAPVSVERLDVATGKPRWRGEMPRASGQENWSAADDHRVYVVTTPDEIGPTAHLAAFDLATGKRLWASVLTSKLTQRTTRDSPRQFAAAGGKLLYVMPGEGLHVLDAATGKLAANIALAVPDNASGLAVLGDRAFVATSTDVIAVDLAQRKVAWTAKLAGANLLAAPGVLYAAAGDTVRALDVADGRELATWGIAGSELAYGTSSGRAPAFVACDGGARLVAFDPTGKVTPVERAVITGTLACPRCPRRERIFPPLQVSIGKATAMTDRRGKFRIEVEGRGTLELAFALPELDAPISWVGATTVNVRLRGKRKYALGTLRVHKDCGPLEDC